MLALKILLCIFAFVSVYFIRTECLDSEQPNPRKAIISIGSFIIFGGAFWIILYVTNYNHFFIVKVILFVTVCLYILFRDERSDIGFYILFCGLVVTVVTGVVCYFNSLTPCEEPDVTIYTTNIIAAKDNFNVKGEIHGNRYSVSGTIGEELVYYYFYKNETGNIVSGHIPAESTEIVPLENSEDIPRVEKIVETSYSLNSDGNKVYGNNENIKYKLYIPASAITEEFIVDLE